MRNILSFKSKKKKKKKKRKKERKKIKLSTIFENSKILKEVTILIQVNSSTKNEDFFFPF
jgi:hypothetical protein